MEASPASTPSGGSSAVSTRSGYPPGTPQPPIEPPRRRSSLAFSHVVLQVPGDIERQMEDANIQVMPTDPPARTLSNVGRKRTLASPLTRSTATPGHVAQMQRIFSTAKASLQLDMRYAASPAGSIGSRLPPRGGLENKTGSLDRDSATEERSSSSKRKDWRYSTISFQLTDKNIDVREPFPENSSLLPNPLCVEVDQSKVFVAEPISSGFTSPVEHQDHDDPMEEDPLLPMMPRTERLVAKRVPLLANKDHDSDDEPFLPDISLSTELEQPLTDLYVSKHREQTDVEIEDSPIVSHLKRQSGGRDTQHLSGVLSNKIFLSTPAKAAAESAKAKRGILKGAFRSVSNKENADTGTDGSSSGSSGGGSVLPCPNPAVHHGVPVALCPDPSLHYRSGTPGFRPSTPNAFGFCRGPSPLRASFQPPGAPFHRASATGSPMPMLRIKSPPRSLGPTYSPRQSCFLPSVQGSHRPPPPVHRPGHPSNNSSSIADHFQPGWYYAAPPTPRADKTTYAFSTAAAKVDGSSQAPDSRIRDSYRTDTLTPLARPTSRFRKNGIGAVASRGVSKYYGNADDNGDQGYGARPPSRIMRSGGGRTPDKLRYRSSPSQPSSGNRYTPEMPKKRRTKVINRGQFAIVEDETAGAQSKAASVMSGVEPMELDDEISAAVRMSIIGVPDDTMSVNEDEEVVTNLSPDVTPFRKGLGPQKKRRPSYWDDDLKEVANSPARKRISGKSRQVRSSPLKGVVGGGMYGEWSAPGVGKQLDTCVENAAEQQVLLDEDDLSGEMARANEVLEKRLSGCVDQQTAKTEQSGRE